MSEPCRLWRGEGYGACDDAEAAPPTPGAGDEVVVDCERNRLEPPVEDAAVHLIESVWVFHFHFSSL